MQKFKFVFKVCPYCNSMLISDFDGCRTSYEDPRINPETESFEFSGKDRWVCHNCGDMFKEPKYIWKMEDSKVETRLICPICKNELEELTNGTLFCGTCDKFFVNGPKRGNE